MIPHYMGDVNTGKKKKKKERKRNEQALMEVILNKAESLEVDSVKVGQ